MLNSSHVDQEFQIFVALPRHYDPIDADTRYPVLYVLDANGMFGMVTETVRMMQILHEVPEMIIVGIGYPVNDFVETLGIRSRDLTPTVDDGTFRKRMADVMETLGVPMTFFESGGAASFLHFIRSELMPFMQNTYRTNPEDTTLFGDSLGGLFALFTLFHQPNTFNRYIIGSPSIAWDNRIALTYEADYATQHADLSAKVFMSAGSLESAAQIANMKQMAQTLRDREYPSLELTTWLFEGETHLSVIPGTISKGLASVFAERA